jgi:hypothetical protein
VVEVIISVLNTSAGLVSLKRKGETAGVTVPLEHDNRVEQHTNISAPERTSLLIALTVFS